MRSRRSAARAARSSGRMTLRNFSKGTRSRKKNVSFVVIASTTACARSRSEQNVDGGPAEILRCRIAMEEDRRRIELRRFQMAIARCEVDFTGTYSLTVEGGVRWPAGRTLDMSAHDVGEVRRHVQHDENRDIVEMRRQSAEE